MKISEPSGDVANYDLLLIGLGSFRPILGQVDVELLLVLNNVSKIKTSHKLECSRPF